jgi:hypothetical protein
MESTQALAKAQAVAAQQELSKMQGSLDRAFQQLQTAALVSQERMVCP